MKLEWKPLEDGQTAEGRNGTWLIFEDSNGDWKLAHEDEAGLLLHGKFDTEELAKAHACAHEG